MFRMKHRIRKTAGFGWIIDCPLRHTADGGIEYTTHFIQPNSFEAAIAALHDQCGAHGNFTK